MGIYKIKNYNIFILEKRKINKNILPNQEIHAIFQINKHIPKSSLAGFMVSSF